jgi:hypothetical protein
MWKSSFAMRVIGGEAVAGSSPLTAMVGGSARWTTEWLSNGGKSCMNEEPNDDSIRARQNIAAAIVLVLLFLGGLWLLAALRSYLKTEECIEAGHRNCLPIDLEAGRGG